MWRIRTHVFRIRQISCNLYSTSRRIPIPIPPPFPVVQSCPEPTCSCAAMPTGLEIDYDQDLNGTMAPYAQQVLISTGQRDWRSRIEDDGLDQSWGILGSRLKKLVFRTGKFADPYNNIVITNSSFTPSTDPSNKSVASAFLFPSFQYIPDIPLDEDGLDRFVRAFLLPLNPHKAHSILPADKLQAIRRDPELQSTFKSMTSLKHSPTILICGHGGRDQRCGIMGPLLESEFGNILKDEGYTVGITPTDKVKHANVGLISHIGGHKYAGNVIIYLPPSLRSGSGGANMLAGKAIWYGRVEPKNVQGIIRETILNGRVIKDHFRGGIDKDGTVLRL
ncbi:Altered inheritance of mitochondria protein 32 [Microsporum audouinii]